MDSYRSGRELRLLQTLWVALAAILVTACATVGQHSPGDLAKKQHTERSQDGVKTLVSEAHKSAESNLEFFLSTDQGTTPVFQVGESTVLEAQTAIDGYLNCYYELAPGSILKLFPNRFQADNLVRANTPISIPGDNSFAIKFDTSTVTERFMCLMTSKKLTPFVAPTIRDSDLAKINTQELEELYNQKVSTLEDLFSLLERSTGFDVVGKILSVKVQ